MAHSNSPPLPPSHSVHSLVQEVLRCLRNSSTLTPSGPDRPTLSHSQAVSWCWCHTWYRWPLVCGDVYSSTSEMVSHAGRGRGASHPVGKCWFVISSIPYVVTCTTSWSRRVCSGNHVQAGTHKTLVCSLVPRLSPMCARLLCDLWATRRIVPRDSSCGSKVTQEMCTHGREPVNDG